MTAALAGINSSFTSFSEAQLEKIVRLLDIRQGETSRITKATKLCAGPIVKIGVVALAVLETITRAAILPITAPIQLLMGKTITQITAPVKSAAATILNATLSLGTIRAKAPSIDLDTVNSDEESIFRKAYEGVKNKASASLAFTSEHKVATGLVALAAIALTVYSCWPAVPNSSNINLQESQIPNSKDYSSNWLLPITLGILGGGALIGGSCYVYRAYRPSDLKNKTTPHNNVTKPTKATESNEDADLYKELDELKEFLESSTSLNQEFPTDSPVKLVKLDKELDDLPNLLPRPLEDYYSIDWASVDENQRKCFLKILRESSDLELGQASDLDILGNSVLWRRLSIKASKKIRSGLPQVWTHNSDDD